MFWQLDLLDGLDVPRPDCSWCSEYTRCNCSHSSWRGWTSVALWTSVASFMLSKSQGQTRMYIGVAALQHGSFERPAVGVEQGNPQVGEGQTAHRISKVFLVFSVFHHCFMQCSCTVSVILLFIYIFWQCFWEMICKLLYTHSHPFSWEGLVFFTWRSCRGMKHKKSKNIHVCIQCINVHKFARDVKAEATTV